MESDFIRIAKWMLPLSWLYGMGVALRNALFDLHILKSHSYNIPIICIGNLSVGGTGKTPHTEYLLRLLSQTYRVAVLSRGYRRKTSGYVLATADSTVADIGDEPWQIKQKFPDIYVAVDRNRRRGIEHLCKDEATHDVDVILLDDAYQHRYVQPGVNILLVDYHRMITDDCLLPAGRLREPQSGKSRADIVIITKCPKDLKPMEFRVLTKALNLYPYQQLFFTTLEYCPLEPLFCGSDLPLEEIPQGTNVLLLTGIASPKQMIMDLEPYVKSIEPMTFADHHQFNERFAAMPEPKMIVTTEKDNARLFGQEGLSEEVRHHIFRLPIRIKFMLGQEQEFNEKIIGYVRKNSRNSILAKAKDDHRSKDSHSAGNRPRTISFRNN